MRIYGIGGVQDLDRQGEILDIAGCDISRLEQAVVTYQPGSGFEDPVGYVTAAYAVHGRTRGPRSVEDLDLLKAVDEKPFIKIEAVIDDETLKKIGSHLSYAISGVTLERQGNVLKHTKVTGVGLTLHPAHDLYRVRIRDGKA